MSVSFRATGKLSDLLVRFKTGYLADLSAEDLEKDVIFSIQEAADLKTTADMEWLKDKLVEVIKDE